MFTLTQACGLVYQGLTPTPLLVGKRVTPVPSPEAGAFLPWAAESSGLAGMISEWAPLSTFQNPTTMVLFWSCEVSTDEQCAVGDSHLRNSSQVLFWTKPLITLFFICWLILEWRPRPTVNSAFFHPGPGHTQTFLKAKFQRNTVYLNDTLWILIVSLLFYLLFHLKMLIKTH